MRFELVFRVEEANKQMEANVERVPQPLGPVPYFQDRPPMARPPTTTMAYQGRAGSISDRRSTIDDLPVDMCFLLGVLQSLGAARNSRLSTGVQQWLHVR